jgi:hypothetical protein
MAELTLYNPKGNLTLVNRVKKDPKTKEYKEYFYSYAAPDMVEFLNGLPGDWVIGNISKEGGGEIPYSSSHRTGKDVDIAIPLEGGGTSLVREKIVIGTDTNSAFKKIKAKPRGKSKSAPDKKTSAKNRDDIEYGYSLNKVNKDGTMEEFPEEAENADGVFYGASIQKPALALVALIAGEELDTQFLDELILYTGKKTFINSNNNNKKLTAKFRKSRKMKKAREDLAKALNINVNKFSIIRGIGSNNQSARAYSKFLAGIINYESNLYLKKHEAAVQKIRDRILKTSTSETGADGSYERKNLLKIVEYANEELQGVQISNVYGKGGFTPSGKTPLSRNVSLIVELDNKEKLIFTMYAKGVGGLDQACRSARSAAEAKGKVSYCPIQKKKLNKFIGQKLAEAIGDQGLNESLNEQESGNYMDSAKAYELVDYAANNGASNIFLGSGLKKQIRDWAKEENKDMGVLEILGSDEDHYDHFHVRLEGAPRGGSSGDKPDSEEAKEMEVGDPEDFKTYKKSKKLQQKRTTRTPGTSFRNPLTGKGGTLPVLRRKDILNDINSIGNFLNSILKLLNKNQDIRSEFYKLLGIPSDEVSFGFDDFTLPNGKREPIKDPKATSTRVIQGLGAFSDEGLKGFLSRDREIRSDTIKFVNTFAIKWNIDGREKLIDMIKAKKEDEEIFFPSPSAMNERTSKMKITKEKLAQIIKEEVEAYKTSQLSEVDADELDEEEAYIKEIADLLKGTYDTFFQSAAPAVGTQQTKADTGEPVTDQTAHEDAKGILLDLLGNAIDEFQEKGSMHEDGHDDVPSAVRAMKTMAEDALEMLDALEQMDGNLPTWWTNKMAVSASMLNKMRDYLLVPSLEEVDQYVPCPQTDSDAKTRCEQERQINRQKQKGKNKNESIDEQ